MAKFKLHPFIVTLGTQLILYTCLLLYLKMGNNNGMAISSLDKSYTDFVKGSILPTIAGQTIPNYVIFRHHPHCDHVVCLEQDHLRQEHVRSGLQ